MKSLIGQSLGMLIGAINLLITQLAEESIEEFNEIWKKEYDVELTGTEAKQYLDNFLHL